MRKSNSFIAIAGFAFDDNVRFVFQDAAKATTNQCMVVNEKY